MVPNHTDWRLEGNQESDSHKDAWWWSCCPSIPCNSNAVPSWLALFEENKKSRWFRNQKEKSTLSLSSKVVKYHPCSAVEPLHHKISGNFVFQTFFNNYYTNCWKGHFPVFLNAISNFFFNNIGVWTNLNASRLITQALKLTIMQVSSGSEVCGTRTGDL
jgi:hypothetical protein